MEKLSYTTFSFDSISYEETIKKLSNLKSSKVFQKTNIPVKIVKENIDIVSYFLFHNFNKSFSCSTVRTDVQYATVTLIHKKDGKTDKEHDRPIIILPILGTVYENLMYNQIYQYFHTVFSNTHSSQTQDIN